MQALLSVLYRQLGSFVSLKLQNDIPVVMEVFQINIHIVLRLNSVRGALRHEVKVDEQVDQFHSHRKKGLETLCGISESYYQDS